MALHEYSQLFLWMKENVKYHPQSNYYCHLYYFGSIAAHGFCQRYDGAIYATDPGAWIGGHVVLVVRCFCVYSLVFPVVKTKTGYIKAGRPS